MRIGDCVQQRPAAGRPCLDLARPPEIPDLDPPVRLLPRWDNLLLAYEDRTRVLAPDLQDKVIMRDGRVLATFLVEGQVAGTWDLEEKARQCTLVLSPLRPLAQHQLQELGEEADRFAAWLLPGGRTGHRIRR